MVTSKQLPNGSVVIKPRRKLAGTGIMLLLVFIFIGALGLAGVGLFAPVRLAFVQEQALGLLHGGVADRQEETYVDGCVQVPGADGLRAVTRTQRITSFNDGTSLETVFSNPPVPTNACP